MSNTALWGDIHYKDSDIFVKKCVLKKNICIFTN